MIEHEPGVCVWFFFFVLRKHQSAITISLNVNVVYQAIWMKYDFNLVALGSIQPRQTFTVSHIRACVIISLSWSFTKFPLGEKKDICVQDKSAKSALNHLKQSWLTALACSLWSSCIFGIFSWNQFCFVFVCCFFSTFRNQDHKSSTILSLIWPQRSDAELKSLMSSKTEDLQCSHQLSEDERTVARSTWRLHPISSSTCTTLRLWCCFTYWWLMNVFFILSGKSTVSILCKSSFFSCLVNVGGVY